ncbi:MAG TPA: Calx-beta domain-containing protein, partial [Pyrinomonadaceae bacterium]
VVVFTSEASNLDPRDTDTESDVFSVRLAGQVQLSAETFTADEGGGAVNVTVTRTGDTSGETFVNFATTDGAASDRRDYTAALGRLRFAPGETSKSFQIVITDDRFDDDGESFNVVLTGPTGATLGAPANATVNIIDNDAAGGPSPVKDASFNTEFFVRQHYADFLGRVPDAGGLAFWIDNIESCGTNQQCREVRKVDTSAAFFLSIEFQETGFLAYRTHKAAFGDLAGKPVPIRLRDFLFDTRQIGDGVVVGAPGWPEQLEANKAAYFNAFVARTAFSTLYPQSMTAALFVDALDTRAGNPLSQAERDALVSDLTNGTKTRAQVLRAVAEDETLRQAETNKAFVLMQYFGYLRRNPDDPQDTNFDGFDFWLLKLNQFGGNYVEAEMVKAFIQSIEYGDRFGF